MLAWGEAWGAALSEPSPLPSVRMPRLLSDTFIGGHELCSHPLGSLHNETQTRHRCTRQTHKGGNGSGQGTAAPSPRLGLAAGSKTRAPRARGELRPLAPAWMQWGGGGQTEPPTQQQARALGLGHCSCLAHGPRAQGCAAFGPWRCRAALEAPRGTAALCCKGRVLCPTLSRAGAHGVYGGGHGAAPGQGSRHCTCPMVPWSHGGQRAQARGSWQCGQPNASSWYRSTCTVHDTKPNLLCSWLVASRSTVSGLALASGGGRDPRSAPQPPAQPLGLCEPAQGTHPRPHARTPRGGSASAPRCAGRGCPSPRSLPAAPPSLRQT